MRIRFCCWAAGTGVAPWFGGLLDGLGGLGGFDGGEASIAVVVIWRWVALPSGGVKDSPSGYGFRV